MKAFRERTSSVKPLFGISKKLKALSVSLHDTRSLRIFFGFTT